MTWAKAKRSRRTGQGVYVLQGEQLRSQTGALLTQVLSEIQLLQQEVLGAPCDSDSLVTVERMHSGSTAWEIRTQSISALVMTSKAFCVISLKHLETPQAESG